MPNFRPAALAALLFTMTTAHRSFAQTASDGDRRRTEREADSVYAAANYKQAALLYERLARVDSTASRYWTQLGMSSAMLKDYAGGARAFTRATAAGGGPIAAYNAGAMFARLGRSDSSFAWLARAITMGFTDTATLAHDDDLAGIRNDARFAQLRHDAMVAPAPCQSDDKYHRFDFWIGNWKVTTVGGTQVGTSHVDVVSGGCGLLENWRDMRGAEGKSLNTFDTTTSGWRQFWVGQAGGVTDYATSEWDGKSIAFTARSRRANAEFLTRLTFTPLDGGVVRQFGEISTDGGKTWGQSFDFRYHPVK